MLPDEPKGGGVKVPFPERGEGVQGERDQCAPVGVFINITS